MVHAVLHLTAWWMLGAGTSGLAWRASSARLQAFSAKWRDDRQFSVRRIGGVPPDDSGEVTKSRFLSCALPGRVRLLGTIFFAAVVRLGGGRTILTPCVFGEP